VPVHVSSEIGRLRAVLVHAPGPELLAVTPRTREHFLYDDIIDVDTAQREHRRFVAVLERFASVYRVGDLLAEIAASGDVRELLIHETTDIVPSAPLARELAEMAPAALVRTLIEGREERPGPLAAALNECGYALPPLPNLFFTRDAAMAINDRVMVGSMRFGARWTEELIMKMLFLHHPALANCGVLYDGSAERRHDYTLEGGDVHPLRRDTVAIGFSERSSPAAIDSLVEMLFRDTAIENVIVVVMPAEDTAIHLDMIFSHLDRELCVVYPPHFIGTERLPILLWRKGSAELRQMPSIFDALRTCGLSMEPVACGGSRRIMQDREQWASGCNCLALRPGLVMSYARNEATLREMERAGFRVVTAADFLSGAARVGDTERAVIAVEGSELVRGGGGPRCMSCPVTRDDPWV
jgi:arginine deiminase